MNFLKELTAEVVQPVIGSEDFPLGLETFRVIKVNAGDVIFFPGGSIVLEKVCSEDSLVLRATSMVVNEDTLPSLQICVDEGGPQARLNSDFNNCSLFNQLFLLVLFTLHYMWDSSSGEQDSSTL